MEPQIDFTKHSYAELLRSRELIDPIKYPKNYQKILEEIDGRPETAILANDGETYRVFQEDMRKKSEQTPREKSLANVRGIAIFQLIVALGFCLNMGIEIFHSLQADPHHVPREMIGFMLGALWSFGAYSCLRLTRFGWYTLLITSSLEVIHLTTSNIIWDWKLFGGLYTTFNSFGRLGIDSELLIGKSYFKFYFGPNGLTFDLGVNLFALLAIFILVTNQHLFQKDLKAAGAANS